MGSLWNSFWCQCGVTLRVFAGQGHGCHGSTLYKTFVVAHAIYPIYYGLLRAGYPWISMAIHGYLHGYPHGYPLDIMNIWGSR